MKQDKTFFRQCVAEFIGTFFLVFGGTAAILGASMGAIANPDLVIPLAFGLSLTVGIFALGHISGGHFNPAVTLAFAIGNHFPWEKVVDYIFAQLLGAITASAVLYLGFHGMPGFTTGPTVPNDLPFAFDADWAVVMFEFFGTFLLMFVITAVSTDAKVKGVPAGLAIGLTLAAMALATGWIGGGSFNPARTLGPALVGGTWESVWVYLIGPIAGAVAAVMAFDYVKGGKKKGFWDWF